MAGVNLLTDSEVTIMPRVIERVCRELDLDLSGETGNQATRRCVIPSPPPELIDAAQNMIKECIKQIDADLADSPLTLAFPDHTIDVWGKGEGEQVVVMTGQLDGKDRFRAVCVFTMGKTGTVSITFKTGKHKNKRCSIPCGLADKIWKPTLAELQWDDEST